MFFAAAARLGCGTRSLDPTHPSGLGGTGGEGKLDAGPGFDARRDVQTIEVIEPPTPHCGNGVVDPGKDCDDGNDLRGDGCNELCRLECSFECGSCGIPNPCTVKVVCGDGVLGVGENCDDGNTISGDGCSADCTTIENGWTCPIAMGPCYPICGDRLVVGPETCDDGNLASGDGCSSICLIEPSEGEQCDNGANNGAAGTACARTCRIILF